MQLAQFLYENGHITYMRTDSTNLASVAIDAARTLVASQYGQEYLPPKAAHLPDQGEERARRRTRPFARRAILSTFPNRSAAACRPTSSSFTI